ncbi:MAG: Spo0E family sporulation regulatory protein-aspartic acid phosphatase [Clostridiales bacterium]|nr:Spo0E family sporulation regulatory protein-aspartic acid phosphatase [Clostridiales bacterium]
MKTKEILLQEIETEKKRLDELITKRTDDPDVILQSRRVDRLLEEYWRPPDLENG